MIIDIVNEIINYQMEHRKLTLGDPITLLIDNYEIIVRLVPIHNRPLFKAFIKKIISLYLDYSNYSTKIDLLIQEVVLDI